MTDTEKWMLAAAYQNAGQANTARQLTKTAGLSVRDYWEFGGTYGSTLRDKAILLEIQTQFGNWLQADELANEIAEMLSTKSWYSTQTTGYMLLALGKYLKALEDKQPDQPRLAGKIRIGNREILFDTDERIFETEISDGFDQSVVIELSDKTTTKRVFTTLSWDGVPLKSNVQDEQKNLSLQVEWLNDDGMRIDPANIKQGTTFWGHFKVNAANSDKRFRHIEEVALVQVLPAGWEIENTRLTGQDLPQWMRNYQLNREEYLDIRDDRIMWFFDLHPSYQRRRGQRQQVSNALDFVVKLNAVTVGEFTLPATLTEAMYNNKFKAVKAGRQIKVIK